MSDIDLLLDEENELTFALTVEGSRPATAQCRLLIESEDMSLVFESDRYDGEEVTVTLPPLKHVIKEGKYNMELEVIVEDKYFKPLTMTGTFEKGVEVKAKPIIKNKKREELRPRVSLSEVKVKSKPSTRVKTQSIVEKKETSKENSKISDKQILAIIDALSSGKIQ